MTKRRARGITAFELIVTASIAVSVMLAASQVLDASGKVAQSTTNVGQAQIRIQRSLLPLGEAIRRGSLASVRHLDGSYFSTGTSDTGFQVRGVQGFLGGPVTGSLVTYRYEPGAGMNAGSLLRVDQGIPGVLSRGITEFSISRTGSLFTISITARAGPMDDRGRSARSTLEVAARNP